MFAFTFSRKENTHRRRRRHNSKYNILKNPNGRTGQRRWDARARAPATSSSICPAAGLSPLVVPSSFSSSSSSCFLFLFF
jgi:hypothetical protein